MFRIFPKYHFTCSRYNTIHRRNISFLNGTNTKYIEEMYNSWLIDPKSVHQSWNVIFKQYNNNVAIEDAFVSPESLSISEKNQLPLNFQTISHNLSSSDIHKESSTELAKIYSLIEAYQNYGHLKANVDPLNISSNHVQFDHILKHTIYGFDDNELENYFTVPYDIFHATNGKPIKLKDLINQLKNIYCSNIGVEYKYILDKETVGWIQNIMETNDKNNITNEERLLILSRLTRATMFERYLAKKYPSEKRFGLEGLETLIPCLKTIIDEFSLYGVEHALMGTAHRGRLNILANVFRSPLQDIFCRFNTEIGLSDQFSGDVKYHLGLSHKCVNKKSGKSITLCIVANPSHLEAVNPVVQGKTHALQHLLHDTNGDKVACIIIHGDAAISGQGIVYESFQLDKLKNYSSKGVIHIVVNNQIGFTTEPFDSRSSHYASDIAKILDVPIFHVNANDPDAVHFVSKTAATYRNQFKKSVVIDLIGYRKNGHNESDNPFFTQPAMYRKISQMEDVLELYSRKLQSLGIIQTSFLDDLKLSYGNILDRELRSAKKITEISNSNWLDSAMSFNLFENDDGTPKMISTGVEKKLLISLNQKCNKLPDGFEPHSGIQRILAQRMDMIKNNRIDWALGEISAFASLLNDGFHVRLSGQDSERGTFSHRHHVLHEYTEEKKIYVPLKNISSNQASYSICNSPLSEYAVLGFDFGYSLASSNFLVCWEAQFGDFCNTAQCIIDQFISSGYKKWLRQSGIVMLLPHGYDGMGPEHSSARIERFLQLSDEDIDNFPDYNFDNFHLLQLYQANWIVANCTTPANLFHILRRQVMCNFRRPLILFSPKNMLRLEQARSCFDEMDIGTIFQRLIPDKNFTDNSKCENNVKRLLLCSGKIYYELVDERSKNHLDSQIAISRIEQLSPFPFDLLMDEIKKYPNAEIFWVQEEPKNQGPWSYVFRCILTTQKKCNDSRKVTYIGRLPSASTATGIKKIHVVEQQSILKSAISLS